MNGPTENRAQIRPRGALWALAALVFLGPLTVWLLQTLRFDKDMQTWLPARDREAQVFNWFRSHFSDDEQVIVTWEGSTLRDPRIQRLAEALRGKAGPDGVVRGGSPYVAEVVTPQDSVQRMVEAGVDPQEALKRLEGIMIGTGWMKVRLTPAGRVERERSIRDLVEHASARLGVVLTVHSQVKDWIDEQYLADLDEGLEVAQANALAHTIAEHDFQLSWKQMDVDAPLTTELSQLLVDYRGFPTASATSGRQLVEECFFAPGTPIALTVTLSEAGSVEPDDAIRSIRWAAEGCGILPNGLYIGGRAVTSAALAQSVMQVAWDASDTPVPLHRKSLLLLASAVAVLMTMILLRSVWLGLLVGGVSWYAVALTVGTLPLTGTPINIILVVAPVIVMTIAVSSAFRIVNQWRSTVQTDPRNALARTMSVAKAPAIAGAMIIAIGMAAITVSPVSPVRQFGLMAAVGSLIAAVAVFFGLPALLQYQSAPALAGGEAGGRGWKQFGLLMYRRPRTFAALCLLVGAASAYGLKYSRTEAKAVRYFPGQSTLIQDYQFIEENLSGITPIDIVVRFDRGMQERTKFLERLEVVRQVENTLSSHPQISGAISLADYQPVVERPDTGARRQDVLKYLRKSQAAEVAIKEADSEFASTFLVTAKYPQDLNRPGDAGLNAAGDEMWRITARASILSDVSSKELLQQLNDRVQMVTRYHPGATHVVTGNVPLFLWTQHVVLRSLSVTLTLAFVVMMFTMIWVLKDAGAGFQAMLPNLVPIAAVLGIVGWRGESLDIGVLLTVAVGLTVAVQGTVTVVMSFVHGLQEGSSRCRALAEGLAESAKSVWQPAFVVAIGLLMLAPADLQPISRFGTLTAMLIGASLISNLILLPTLLAGSLGAILERRVKLHRTPKSTAEAVVHPPVPVPHISLPQPHTARQAG